jgi:DNA-binding NtrC family response regulator
VNIEPRILVVDHLRHWRRGAAQELCNAGFRVSTSDQYAVPKGPEGLGLVCLGCARPGREEEAFVTALVKAGIPVVVAASRMTAEESRHLFLAGALDANLRPMVPGDLARTCRAAFRSLERRRDPTRVAAAFV